MGSKKERKVFLEDLPRWRFGQSKPNGVVNWKKSIGYKVKFRYDYIKGEIEITDYHRKNNRLYLNVKYKNIIYAIRPDVLANCKIREILWSDLFGYKYKIGDIVNKKIKILEQIQIIHNRTKNETNTYDKGYKYQCLVCGNIDTLAEYQINANVGCNVCNNQKVLIGYNDIWTTNPELGKLLNNPDDGYKYMQNSNKKVNWKCSSCGSIIKNKTICQINRYRLSCPKCSDGISYPNKLMYALLEQLNVNFQTEYSPKWIKPKRYDFYFELDSKKYIIEMDGGWHEKDNKMSGRTAEESQKIDKYKELKAKEHSINIIRVDSKISELKFIKQNILNSELFKLFNLNNIDWLKCEKYTYNSLVKKCCDLWNDGIYSIIGISKIIKINYATVRKYLKQGTKLGWCYYNAQKERIKIGKQNGKKHKVTNKRKVICLNNNKIYNSISDASKSTKINSTFICNYCKGRIQYIGGNKILQWQYYDEYLKQPKKLLNYKKRNKKNTRKQKVICLNNKKIFDSIMDANKFYNIKSNSGITNCCKEKQKSSGKHPQTGEPLKWMYYEDYITSNINLNNIAITI